jgi:putative endopeptidase
MKTLRWSVSALTLAIAAPLAAADDHPCIDEGCTMVSLIGEAGGAQRSVAGTIQANRMGTWGIDTAGMDKSVKPGDDFFGFVNGNWARNSPIPADRSSYGGFAILRELSDARVRQLVESYPATDPRTGGDQPKVAAIYRSYMDEAAVEKLDAIPLLTRLAPIYQVKSKEDMAALMGRSLGGFGGSFFGAGVNDDAKNPTQYALSLRQSGLGLGDRAMYLDAKFRPQKERYQQYVAQMLEMAGWPTAQKSAADVVALESKMAEAHWTIAEGRNRDKTYNPMSAAELQQAAPGFPWAAFRAGAGLDRADRLIVTQNTAVPKLAQIFSDADPQVLKAWQIFHTADEIAPLSSKRFADAEFDFRSKFLRGQPQQQERWKRAVNMAENTMGEAIGRDYVVQYFPAESKMKMDQLVTNLRSAMKARLERLSWMAPETKQEALKKLESFGLKIGYPEKWRDYSGLQIVSGDVVGNLERASQFEWDFRRNRIEQPVDKTEWSMTPQTVNAYYSSVKNEIVFPSAILQPPFFDPNADPAVNYGAIGGVIGHEITHGFDDQGRKSDGAGVLRDWWQPQDAAKFEAQATRLGNQYEAYDFAALPGMHINPRISMGENIGDLGGVLLALDAYRTSLNGQPAPVIEGFTGDQRVFLGWAQVWRTKFRDEALRQQLVNGPHSPGQIRAFAPLRNVDAWYEAFNVQPGDKNYVAPENRVRIW